MSDAAIKEIVTGVVGLGGMALLGFMVWLASR